MPRSAVLNPARVLRCGAPLIKMSKTVITQSQNRIELSFDNIDADNVTRERRARIKTWTQHEKHGKSIELSVAQSETIGAALIAWAEEARKKEVSK